MGLQRANQKVVQVQQLMRSAPGWLHHNCGQEIQWHSTKNMCYLALWTSQRGTRKRLACERNGFPMPAAMCWKWESGHQSYRAARVREFTYEICGFPSCDRTGAHLPEHAHSAEPPLRPCSNKGLLQSAYSNRGGGSLRAREQTAPGRGSCNVTCIPSGWPYTNSAGCGYGNPSTTAVPLPPHPPLALIFCVSTTRAEGGEIPSRLLS